MKVEFVFVAVMAALVVIGVLCAKKLSEENPFWVRMIVLSPCLAALLAVIMFFQDAYVPYFVDLVFAATMMAMYMLVYSRFTSRPWLDIRADHDCQEPACIEEPASRFFRAF